MTYKTQWQAAAEGVLTPQMQTVLQNEPISKDELLKRLREGEIVIPANKVHKNLKARGIGRGLKTKVNVNLGVSEDCMNREMEWKKVDVSRECGADAIMDLSTFGNTREFRRELVERCELPLGTVPIYDTLARTGKDPADITIDEWFETVVQHGEDGVDFITIHAGLNRVAAERLKINPRLTHVVSRGGSILLEWMLKNNRENPFYEYFDRLLEIAAEYDITLSLGDGLRPGSLKDATDAPQIQELIILGELTRRSRDAGVQVMIEGPGHVPLNEIITNVQLQKKLCHGAPFYVLGPLVTDVAPGYDHITSAIGGALAGYAGADFLCYVTPAEHLRLPDLEDVKEGLMATRIAAHAADVAKGLPGARDWDDAMSAARKRLDWEKMYELAIDPHKAREYRKNEKLLDEEVCSMCGKLCAVKRSRTLLEPMI